MSLSSIKVLHLADLHLNRSLRGGKLKLPLAKAEQRQKEQREILTKALELAKSEAVDIILIPGDLWEEDHLTLDTVAFVQDALARVNLPVVISPGNHDYYSAYSHYSDSISEVRLGNAWPSNVLIFKDYEFRHVTFPSLTGVSITGMAYKQNVTVSDRLLAQKIRTPDASIKLALLHGSRDSHFPGGKKIALPFSDEELLAQNFDYVALGHYHKLSLIQDHANLIKAAYPGAAFALSISDNGAHGAIVCTVHPGGVTSDDFKFFDLDERRIAQMKVDVSGLTEAGQVENKISETIREAGLSDQDMMLVELTGVFPRGNRINLNERFLNELCFHLQLDVSRLKPEWSLEADPSLSSETTEAKFRLRMKELIESAEEQGNYDEVARLQNAMYYGLDALHGTPVQMRRHN